MGPTATELSWPFDNQLIDENTWATYFGPLADDGIFGDPGGQSCQVYADGSGRLVKRRAGSAWVHTSYYVDTAEKPITIGANTSNQPRTDRIVLRRDAQANDTYTDVVPGSPSATAPVPALTQTAAVWEIPIARVRVDPGVTVIDASKVSDERRFQGLRLWRVTNKSQLPTLGVPLWQEAVDVAGTSWRWTGSAWQQVRSNLDVGPTPWLGAVTHASGASITPMYPVGQSPYPEEQSGGMYVVNNGWVTGACTLVAGSTIYTPGSLRPSMPLPVNRTAHPVNSQIGSWTFTGDLFPSASSQSSGWSEGSLIIGPASVVNFTTWRGLYGGNSNYLGQPLPGYGSGGSLAVTISPGDLFTWTFSYYAGA